MLFMRLAIFCLFLIFGVNAVAAQQSIIQVETNVSGDAVWTMEKLIPL